VAALIIESAQPLTALILYVAAWLILGIDVIYQALRKLFSGQLFDENFLMTVATIGALIIGEYPEAVAVMLFYQIGEIFQDMAVNHSRSSIRALTNLRPDYANRLHNADGNEYDKIAPEQAVPGDLLLIRPGERVPLDGIVIEGSSEIDTSALTGESLPQPIGVEEEVLAGSINGGGLLKIRVDKPYAQSAIARIMEMVEQASARKSKAELFITRFAAWYTPIMTVIALILAVVPPLILNQPFADWIYRAMILLVISCPCALVLSVPLSYFAGIGAASAKGILVKGGQFLDRLAEVNQIVFDKTGTLTQGDFNVSEIHAVSDWSSEQILALAALLEGPSDHPIAVSIKQKAAVQDVSRSLICNDQRNYLNRPGYGVQAEIDQHSYKLGNDRMLSENNVVVPSELDGLDADGQYIWLVQDSRLIGAIRISDNIRPEAGETLFNLKKLGVSRIAMLTGDRPAAAGAVAEELLIDEYYAGLLPGQKVEYLEQIMSRPQENAKNITMFVGDGINDAPVLARADLGVAFGSAADAAVESADLVIMGNDIGKLTESIKLGRRTAAIVKQNVVLTLGLKVLIMMLAVVGLSGIWQAVFADVGVSLLAVLNSLRLLRK
jgi:Cd2+/Zn2+-exporting ATPase